MKFTKMEGIGNDYIYINNLSQQIKNPGALAKRLSDRHFGIGSDGLILVEPSDQADFKMVMYNSDGSQGKMCGNGIRCFSKFIHDQHLSTSTSLMIETLSGLRNVTLDFKEGRVLGATVDMGIPIIDPLQIPLAINIEPLDYELTLEGRTYRCSFVSMGNPHCVIFADTIDTLDLAHIGPLFENHPLFPESINTEFITVLDRQNITMRVWERGSGETLACGTGACASAYIANTLGKVDHHVTVHLKGGSLSIALDPITRHIRMSGPATTVFTGELEGEYNGAY